MLTSLDCPRNRDAAKKLFCCLSNGTDQVVCDKVDSLSMGYIEFFTTDTRDRDLNWSFLTLLPYLRLAAYLAAQLLFLVLILSSADFFLQVVNFYGSETTLDKFYIVNVIRSNDLSYDGCRKVQARPPGAFPAKG